MITVVIPAYNAAQSLAGCLTALQDQSKPPDQIIVVDDGSLDQTIQVAREFGAAVISQSHQGPAAARNLGIRESTGDYIIFTDADCRPETTWVFEMLKPFSDPRVVGVKGSYRTSQLEPVARLAQIEFEERYDLLEQQATIDFIDTYSAAFRIAVLRDMGGFNPAFSQNEDVDLSYRLARAGYRLVFNRRAVVYHRHPQTWLEYFRLKIERGYWRVMAYRLHPGKALRDSYTPQLLKIQVALLYLAAAFAILSILYAPLVLGSLVSLVVLFMSAVPFCKRVIQKEKALAGSAIIFVLLRTLAFAMGILKAAFGVFFLRKGPLASGERVENPHV